MVRHIAACVLASGASLAHADCGSLPGWGQLKQALQAAVAAESSGLDLQMWATVVDRDGVVCAVTFSGLDRGAQWPGSRVISAQKANTANAFSLEGPNPSIVFPNGLALSTANLYSAVQPGGSLFGLQHSNPVDTSVAYGGNSAHYGMANDFMVGRKIGGVNVFGGGLALYDSQHKVVGAVGVSGDTSCSDHMIGWRVRALLGFDHLAGVAGVSGDPARPDNIVYDIVQNPNGGTGASGGGFGHPTCIRSEVTSPSSLPPVKS
ncbi:MAG: heme-binding protein [Caldimonas sp.]